MSTVSALPANIVQWLSAQEALQDITFLTEFPAVKKAIPLKKVIVAVGLESVVLTDKFESNGHNILNEHEYCRSAAMKISLAVHVPFSRGGHTCHEVFSNVVDALTFASDLYIKESGCSAITSDRDTDALVLKGYLDISAEFCPAASSDMHFQSFLNKDLLCGSHIRDASIHVTTEDKTRWEHPNGVSSYLGNGDRSRTIVLGFQPAYVMVFAAEYPPSEYDTTSGKTHVYSAHAVSGGYSVGIELTNNGFRVLNNETVGGCTSFLNRSGVDYRFYYFR